MKIKIKKINPLFLIPVVVFVAAGFFIVRNQLVMKEESNTTTISGVKVKGFSKTETLNENNDKLLVNNDRYQILYYPLFKSFLIYIKDQDFESARKEAESDLLEVLEISEDESCKLNVQITTPSFINPEKAKENYKLSWCGQ